MALLVRLGMAVSLAALAFGQRPGGMPGAFGRGALPSGGGLPSRPPIGAGILPSLRQHHHDPQPPSVVVVPFPVYGPSDASPLESGGPDQAQDAADAQAADIEQPPPFSEDGPPPGIPRVGRPNPDENSPTCLGAPAGFEPPPGPPRPPAPEAQPTIYLIALKDDRIVQALGYWIEDGALHYISAAYGLNQVSLSLVDWDFSRRLNEERDLKFDLPPAN